MPASPSRPLRVVVLTPAGRGGIGRMMRYYEECVAGIKDPSIRFFATHGPKWRSVLFFPFRLLKFLWLSMLGIDICHINISAYGSTFRKSMYIAICRAFNVRYILHLHGGRYPAFFSQLSLPRQNAIKRMFGGATRIVVLGETWREFVHNTLEAPLDHIEIVPNAAPGPLAVPQRSADQAPTILFLGLVHYDKGVDVLIDALARPQLKELDWTALLAGGGEIDWARGQADQAKLGERIEFLGWCGPEAVNELLSTSTIFVLPSRVENLPLALIEAMAFGLCVIATPVGAIPEVISNNQNGMIVPVGDSAALEAALLSVVTDRDRSGMLARNARITYEERFSMKAYIHAMFRIYKQSARLI